MSATDLPPAAPSSADPDDDAPEPRTPLRRWLLAAALAVPVAAAYALVVLLVARALFLDDEAEAVLADRVTLASPPALIWGLAATAALGGTVAVLRSVLEPRTTRNSLIPAGETRPWVWHCVWAGSLIGSLTLAAVIASGTRAASHMTPGEAALLFAALAGFWAPLAAGITALLAIRHTLRNVPEEPEPLEGIEEAWFQQAAAQCFWDIVSLTGFTAFVLAVWRLDLDAGLALAAVVAVAAVDFPIRLNLLRRREERAGRDAA